MARQPAVTGIEPPDGGEVRAVLELLERLYDGVRESFVAELVRMGHARSAEDRGSILTYIRGMREAVGQAAGGDWRPLQYKAKGIRSLAGKQIAAVPPLLDMVMSLRRAAYPLLARESADRESFVRLLSGLDQSIVWFLHHASGAEDGIRKGVEVRLLFGAPQDRSLMVEHCLDMAETEVRFLSVLPDF